MEWGRACWKYISYSLPSMEKWVSLAKTVMPQTPEKNEIHKWIFVSCISISKDQRLMLQHVYHIITCLVCRQGNSSKFKKSLPGSSWRDPPNDKGGTQNRTPSQKIAHLFPPYKLRQVSQTVVTSDAAGLSREFFIFWFSLNSFTTDVSPASTTGIPRPTHQGFVIMLF